MLPEDLISPWLDNAPGHHRSRSVDGVEVGSLAIRVPRVCRMHKEFVLAQFGSRNRPTRTLLPEA